MGIFFYVNKLHWGCETWQVDEHVDLVPNDVNKTKQISNALLECVCKREECVGWRGWIIEF